jgi:phosphatidylinositol glycan class F
MPRSQYAAISSSRSMMLTRCVLQPALISLLLTLALGTPILLFILILLGAPLTTHIPHTLLLSAHLSLLTGVPLVYTRGISASTWRAIAALEVPIDDTFGASLGACLGAWLGAVPIPLDWDRDWQRWPVTVMTGAYIGWALGKTLGGLWGRGMVVDLRP